MANKTKVTPQKDKVPEKEGQETPSDSPLRIVDLLNKRVGEVVNSAEYRLLIEKSGSVAISSTPREFYEVIEQTANDALRSFGNSACNWINLFGKRGQVSGKADIGRRSTVCPLSGQSGHSRLLEICLGTSPSQAAKSRPFVNASPHTLPKERTLLMKAVRKRRISSKDFIKRMTELDHIECDSPSQPPVRSSKGGSRIRTLSMRDLSAAVHEDASVWMDEQVAAIASVVFKCEIDKEQVRNTRRH